jgi:rod shape-determining protein MreD
MNFFIRATLLWVAVAFIGDTLIGPLIAIKGIGPDFSIIALVILALATGPVPATAGGFLVGLVQDLAHPNLLGLRALCKCLLGFGLGRLRGRLVYGVPLVEGTVVFISVVAHDFIFLLVESKLTDEGFLLPFFTQTLPVALYTGIIGIPLLRLADLLGILRQED